MDCLKKYNLSSVCSFAVGDLGDIFQNFFILALL